VRKGQWHVAPAQTVVTVLGGAQLDFRYVNPPGEEITVNCVTAFGGVDIIVPPEMVVIDSGVAICGGRNLDSEGPQDGGRAGTVLRLRGVTVCGGVNVTHKRRKDGKR
jgi:hypothetical protein